MFTIPSKETKKFSQPNYGDTQGNLWGTFNINLTKNMGRVRVTRTETVFSDTYANGFSTPIAFAYFNFNNKYYAYGRSIYVGGTSPLDSFTKDTTSNSPVTTGNIGDMKVFNTDTGRFLFVATDQDIKYSNGTTWTTLTSLSFIYPHIFTQFADKLYYTDDENKIYSINRDLTVNTSSVYTLDLSFVSGHISWMVAGSNRIWIGVTTSDGSHGSIYEWDGQSENIWSKNYIIEAQGSCGCAIWNDTPYVLDIEGRLLAFNGSGFAEVARLPIMQYDSVPSTYNTIDPIKLCHFNGIQYINDAILININNRTTAYSDLENFPAGIYTYTKENGLVHTNSPSITQRNGSIKDYGQSFGVLAGAIFDASSSVGQTGGFNLSSVMFGNLFAFDSISGTTFRAAINVDILQPQPGDTVFKRQGYIVTPYLETNSVKDIWQNIIIKYRKMLDSADRIMVKYRTTKDIPKLISSVVWDDNISFTNNSSLISSLNVGDEIEIIHGNGGGSVAHITSIVNNGSDFTVTVDEAIIGISAGDYTTIRFQTWKKLPDINADNFQFADRPLAQYNKDTEIQFKIVMNWTDKDNELREVIVVNQTDQYSK